MTAQAAGLRARVRVRPAPRRMPGWAYGAVTVVGIQLVWTKYNAGISPSGGSCHIDAEGDNTNTIGILGAGCSPNSTQTARLRDFGSTWAKDMATGSYTASHYCGNSDNLSTCGSTAMTILGGSLPLAAVIPNS